MMLLGIRHYGGTLGLYEQPVEEQARALALYEEIERRARPKKERTR